MLNTTDRPTAGRQAGQAGDSARDRDRAREDWRLNELLNGARLSRPEDNSNELFNNKSDDTVMDTS